MINIITSLLYGILMALAFIIGSFLLWKYAKKENFESDTIFDWILSAVIVGILLSRLIFIFEHFSVYREDIFRWIHLIRYPGLSSKGFILGFLLSSLYFFRKKKLNAFLCLDLLVLPFLYSWLLAQSACMVNSCLAANTFTLSQLKLINVMHPVNIYYIIAILFLISLFKKINKIKISEFFMKKDKSTDKTVKHGLYFSCLGVLFFLTGLILENFIPYTLYFNNLNLRFVFNLTGLIISSGLFIYTAGTRDVKLKLVWFINKIRKGNVNV